jgi:hypothetical protein
MNFHHASGSVLHRAVMFVLACLVAGAGLASLAHAADGPRTGFATVWRLHGTVTASGLEAATARKLQLGDAVHVGERIRAEANGEAVFQTHDEGYIAVRPAGDFTVEEFSAERQRTDRIFIRQFQGGLRLLTGWIGKLNPGQTRVFTPKATIGIRGTDHEPYVITEDLAQALSQAPGTYDKVNVGGTVLEVKDGSVAIDPGKVGFARLPSATKNRALMSLLLPVILDKVPDFYVPGPFDGELDRISVSAHANTVAPNAGGVQVAQSDASKALSQGAGVPAAPTCDAQQVARDWLQALDGALERRDANGVQALMASDVRIRSRLRNADGSTRLVSVSREEFAASTRSVMGNLADYRQTRLSTSGQLVKPGNCSAISVTSRVIEQGRQNGKPYRFEMLEEFQLEWRQGQWLATQAQTSQQ